MIYLCWLLKEIQKLCTALFFKDEEVKEYCNKLMNQEGLENFVNNIIDELKKERERLLDNFT